MINVAGQCLTKFYFAKGQIINTIQAARRWIDDFCTANHALVEPIGGKILYLIKYLLCDFPANRMSWMLGAVIQEDLLMCQQVFGFFL